MANNRYFSKIIKRAREAAFPSIKAFWQAKQPSCSYYQYSLIENGTDLPTAALASEIAELLCLNLKSTMLAWVKDLMPTDELRELFSDPNDDPSLKPSEITALASVSADESPLVINRMQAKLLIETPKLHEILSFMNTFACYKSVFTAAEVANAVMITERDGLNALEVLYEHGLLNLAGIHTFSCRRHFTIPSEPDLEILQRQVFNRAVENFNESMSADNENTLIRATLTRLFTPEQYSTVGHRFRALRNWVWSLPEIAVAESKPYTIGIFGAERRFR